MDRCLPSPAESATRTPTRLLRLFTIVSLGVFIAAATTLRAAPVTVGKSGNEPLVIAGPDGTLYISALQHLYRSTDAGATWTKLPGPIYSSTLNVATDSSLAFDP